MPYGLLPAKLPSDVNGRPAPAPAKAAKDAEAPAPAKAAEAPKRAPRKATPKGK